MRAMLLAIAVSLAPAGCGAKASAETTPVGQSHTATTEGAPDQPVGADASSAMVATDGTASTDPQGVAVPAEPPPKVTFRIVNESDTDVEFNVNHGWQPVI